MRRLTLLYFTFLFLYPVQNGFTQNVGYVATVAAGSNRLNDGGSALNTLLRRPMGVAVDAAGNIYVSDQLDNRVRKITAGIVTTAAGTGVPGYDGDGGQGSKALLNGPAGIVCDPAGNLYIADRGNNVVRLLKPDGTISTFAGNGSSAYNGENIAAAKAQFDPESLALDSHGSLYISDLQNFRVRKVDSSGNVTTVAGNGTYAASGDGAAATSASIGVIFGIAVDEAGNVYLADGLNLALRMVDTKGIIQTVAGNGSLFPISGANPALSTVMAPTGVAIGADGRVYVAESLSNEIIAMTPASGALSTVAGNGNMGFLGDKGVAVAAELNFPLSLVFDSKGNLYFVDEGNQRVRGISKYIIDTVAGSASGDGGAATAAFFNFPNDAFVTASGDLYSADYYNGEVRKVAAGSTTINSFGQFGILTPNGNPISLARDSAGNLYTGTDKYTIAVTAVNGQTRVIAGTGTPGASGDGQPAASAKIDDPEGLAVDGQNNLYIADYSEEVVRKIDAGGVISHVAGNGHVTASGDGGSAATAGLDPSDVAVDSHGNLFVADRFNNRIRKIGLDGNISTVVGTGVPGSSGDGGKASNAQLDRPTSVAVDGQGNLFITDEGNFVVRRVDGISGVITTIAGNGTGYPSPGGSGPARGIAIDPHRVRIDPAGGLIVTDLLNDRIYRLTTVTITPSKLAVVSGDAQTGGTASTLSLPLTAQVVGSDGFGYSGVQVTFAVTTGAATVSPKQVVSDANGNAATIVTFGSSAGSVIVQASAPGLASVNFTLTAVNSPMINPKGIVGAASSTPAVASLTPGAIVTIFGTQFAPAGTSHSVSTGDLVGGNLPTNLSNVCVLIGGVYAPLFYVSTTQINAQVPQIPVPSSSTTVQVVSDCGKTDEMRSGPVLLPSLSAAPEFFYSLHSPNGKNYVAAIDAATGAYVGPAGLISGGNFAPAKVGDIVTAYATGLGATNPAFTVGVPVPGAAPVTATASVQLGGVTLSAADVLYVGATPTYSGLYQVNLRVPAGVAVGDQPLVITVGGVASPANAVLTIGK